MEFEHKRFGKCVVSDITQKQLEDFYRDMKGLDSEPLTIWRGASVRSAAKHGILLQPVYSAEDVDGLKPGLVVWLADCITKSIAEALTLDPLS